MRTLSRSVVTFSARAVLGLSSLIVSCADHEQTEEGVTATPRSTVPTYEEFKVGKYEAALNKYIVQGDVLLTEAELRIYYDRLVEKSQKTNAADGVVPVDAPLLVGFKDDKDQVWPSVTATNLTYCIDQASFGADYGKMVATMASAASAWEQHAHVDFVHLADLDSFCTTNSDVVFVVQSYDFTGTKTLASAFYPGWAREDRVVLAGKGTEDNTGVYTHELGHVLGFWHENTRQSLQHSTKDDCDGWDGPEWRALTDNDGVRSIMDCTAPYSGLTAKDIQGVACEYGDINGNLPGNCQIPGVYYRAHISNFGWQGVMVNNDVAGTQGQGDALEAIQIARNVGGNMKVCYAVHASELGWLPEECDGDTAGTTGEGRQLEAVSIRLVDAPPGCSVSYQAHVAQLGWTAAVKDGAVAGTTGQGLGLEALRVKLSAGCF